VSALVHHLSLSRLLKNPSILGIIKAQNCTGIVFSNAGVGIIIPAWEKLLLKGVLCAHRGIIYTYLRGFVFSAWQTENACQPELVAIAQHKTICDIIHPPQAITRLLVLFFQFRTNVQLNGLLLRFRLDITSSRLGFEMKFAEQISLSANFLAPFITRFSILPFYYQL